MAPSTSGAPASRSPRVSKAEAMARFVDAVIAHLGSRPIAEITDQLVAETAGINRASLYRYFGTHDQLLDAVVTQLTRDWLKLVSATIPTTFEVDPVVDGTKNFSTLMQSTSTIFEIVAYLAGVGYRSKQIGESLDAILGEWTKTLVTLGIEPRAAEAFAFKNLALNFTRAAVTPVFELPATAIADVTALTLVELTNHRVSTEKLGWGKSDSAV